MAVIYPLTGYRQNKNQEKYFKGNRYNKTSWYRKSMVWSWIPTLLVLAAMLFAGTDPSDLGFRMPSAQINEIKPVLFYISVSAAALYTLYMLFSIISIRFSKKIREHHASQIPPGLKHILPVTKQEKKTWILLSFTAGFRGVPLQRILVFCHCFNFWILPSGNPDTCFYPAFCSRSHLPRERGNQTNFCRTFTGTFVLFHRIFVYSHIPSLFTRHDCRRAFGIVPGKEFS